MIEQRVALIDIDHLLYVCTHNKKDQEEKTLSECLYVIDDYMNNLQKFTAFTHYIAVLTKGKCFRYNINPEYKSNRKDFIKPKYFDECRTYLEEQYNAISINALESDDVVSICSKLFDNSFIISPDKDVLNLAGNHLNPRKLEWVLTSEKQAEYYFWKSMIVGDSSDGILCLRGKGEKYAEKLLEGTVDYRLRVFNEYINYYGEYDGIKEFTTNYLSLKIIDKPYKNFVKPTLQEWSKKNEFENKVEGTE